jgi:PIN domain nuclease of toxin-antitoxin system
VRHLIDTHALIWFADQDQLLGVAARAIMTDPANELLLSAATIWEIAIKVSLNKLSLSLPFREWMEKAIVDLRLVVLPVSVHAAETLIALPNHHRDPFDRLLVAQAIVEDVPLVSLDGVFDRYGIRRIWR